MTEEKARGKTLVIAIGILVVALIGSNAFVYMSMQAQVSTLSAEKASLQAQYNTLSTEHQGYMSTHTYTNTQYNALNTEYQDYMSTHTHTNAEYNDLVSERDEYYDMYVYYLDEYNIYYNIANLNYHQTFVSFETVTVPYGYTYYYWTYEFYYAGYLNVIVHYSSVANTYVRVIYGAYGVTFDQTIYVDGTGTVSFPILPCDYVEVRVGNYHNIAPATYTISIALYY